METCTGWNLPGNANLIERRGEEKQLRLLLKEAELHHFWCSLMLCGMHSSELCEWARSGGWCFSPFVGRLHTATQAACDGPSFSKPLELSNWIALIPSPAPGCWVLPCLDGLLLCEKCGGMLHEQCPTEVPITLIAYKTCRVDKNNRSGKRLRSRAGPRRALLVHGSKQSCAEQTEGWVQLQAHSISVQAWAGGAH